MKLDRILVPIDFSDLSEQALQTADQMAVERGASLTLLHVYPVVEVVVMDFAYVQPPDKVQEVLDASRKRLQELASTLKTPADRVTVQVRSGTPAMEIVESSGKHDLVVMPTHGHTGVKHFMMGSVAERVVQAARCSVLVVKNG